MDNGALFGNPFKYKRIFLLLLILFGTLLYFSIAINYDFCGTSDTIVNRTCDVPPLCPKTEVSLPTCPKCDVPPPPKCDVPPPCPKCDVPPPPPSCPPQETKTEEQGFWDIKKLRITPTTTTPPFVFVNLGAGVVSDNVIKFGSFAPIETIIFKTILKDRCKEANTKPPLIVDIGGNMGYFTTFSAKFGCRVKSFEPVPGPRRFIELNRQINEVNNLVEIFPNAVTDFKGKVKIKESSDWGLSVIDQNGNVEVDTMLLKDIINEDVLILKIDVEGHETSVLSGIVDISKKYNVENLIVETTKNNQIVGRKIINDMIMNDYVVISYGEEYFTPNHNKNINQITCKFVSFLSGDKEWIPYGDLWYVKKGSKTHEALKNQYSCSSN